MKTNYIIFGNKKVADISISINNEMIARTYEAKFLGIIMQANLKWNTHIVQIMNNHYDFTLFSFIIQAVVCRVGIHKKLL